MTRRPPVGARTAVRLGDSGSLHRGGFTLLVVVVFIIVYGLVLLAGIGFVADARLDVERGEGPGLRNLRSALETLERDISRLRAPAADGETTLVYADVDAIAFFYETATDAASETQAVASTELVTLWLEPDASTPRSDDFRLLRHVEGGKTTVVARRLLRDDSAPFFEYLVSAEAEEASEAPTTTVPSHLLPIGVPSEGEWSAGLVAADSAADARTPERLADRASGRSLASGGRGTFPLRAVRVRLRGSEDAPGGGSGTVTVRRLIPLGPPVPPTLGPSDEWPDQECGDAPRGAAG